MSSTQVTVCRDMGAAVLPRTTSSKAGRVLACLFLRADDILENLASTTVSRQNKNTNKNHLYELIPYHPLLQQPVLPTFVGMANHKEIDNGFFDNASGHYQGHKGYNETKFVFSAAAVSMVVGLQRSGQTVILSVQFHARPGVGMSD